MRWFVALGVAVMVFTAGTRLGWASDLGQLLGGPKWALVPEGQGINAFVGKWVPIWDHDLIVMGGEFYIWPKGRMGSARQDQSEYRIVKETPYYIIILRKDSDDVDYYSFYYIVAERIENGRVEKLRMPYCDDRGAHMAGERHWRMSNKELLKFWDEVSPCNPLRFPPTDPQYGVFWGDRWTWDVGYNYLGPLDFPPPPLNPLKK